MQGISGDVRDGASDGARDSEWMTYAELAKVRGISLRAAVRMTQRQRLRRQPGNDGKVRVLVPRDMLKPSHRASQGDGRNVDRPADLDDASDAQDALRTAIEALQGENTALKGQVETQAALIAELRVGLDQERQAIAGALSRAEAAEARAQAAEAQVRLQAQEAQHGSLRLTQRPMRMRCGRRRSSGGRGAAGRGSGRHGGGSRWVIAKTATWPLATFGIQNCRRVPE
jgi:hypothetical protein